MPRGIIILLIIASLLAIAALVDKLKADGGSPLRRKAWLRTSLIMFVVSAAVTFLT